MQLGLRLLFRRIFNGSIDYTNVTGILPPSAAYSGVDGAWDIGGWTLFLGALYIAAWSTYGFETAVCYTRELKNPKTDTFKAIFFSGLLCCVFFFLIPAIPAVLGNFLIPLMIGAKDLAFPKINLLSWYIYMLGGLFTTYAMLQPLSFMMKKLVYTPSKNQMESR